MAAFSFSRTYAQGQNHKMGFFGGNADGLHGLFGKATIGVYATNGQACPFPEFASIQGVFIESTGTYWFVYNKSTGKIQGYTATGTEIDNSTDLSAVTVGVLVFGVTAAEPVDTQNDVP